MRKPGLCKLPVSAVWERRCKGMRQQVKELIAEIMKRYADTVESLCIVVGEYVTEATAKAAERVRHYGGYLLAGLAIVLAWLLLAVTMPAWYLPYKYFTRKGANKHEQKAEEKGV